MATDVDETPTSASGEGEDIRELDALAEALLSLRSGDELTRFLRDLCTRAELEALAHRWLIARLLEEGLPYLAVADHADASTTTVTRVSQWLHHGTGGYRLALDRMKARSSKPGKAGS
ncbi:MAG TPA: YerC/YecD family TrpR-related protein [Gaiellaceae bacterium]